MRKGQKVETITKTVGQPSRSGVVIDIRDGDFIEVEWDDGHTSVISRTAVTEASSGASKTKTNS